MSDTTVEADEQEWREDCELCGTRLETGFVAFAHGGDQEGAETGSPSETIAQDFCPNPDCPGKSSDLAPAAEHSHEPPHVHRADGATGPGSLGGDNGGG